MDLTEEPGARGSQQVYQGKAIKVYTISIIALNVFIQMMDHVPLTAPDLTSLTLQNVTI